jgi:hypothetical protein
MLLAHCSTQAYNNTILIQYYAVHVLVQNVRKEAVADARAAVEQYNRDIILTSQQLDVLRQGRVVAEVALQQRELYAAEGFTQKLVQVLKLLLRYILPAVALSVIAALLFNSGCVLWTKAAELTERYYAVLLQLLALVLVAGAYIRIMTAVAVCKAPLSP